MYTIYKNYSIIYQKGGDEGGHAQMNVGHLVGHRYTFTPSYNV